MTVTTGSAVATDGANLADRAAVEAGDGVHEQAGAQSAGHGGGGNGDRN